MRGETVARRDDPRRIAVRSSHRILSGHEPSLLHALACCSPSAIAASKASLIAWRGEREREGEGEEGGGVGDRRKQ